MNKKAKIFQEIMDSFENEDIKKFAIMCMKTIPDYFYDVGASSTGKWHPTYALGDLGLARHTCALVRIMNHLFNVESIGEKFQSRERDLLRVAGIMHDSRKSGSQEDYEKNKYTKFDHPLLAAKEVRAIKDIIPAYEVEFVANAIESHMGQWNTDKRSEVVLPKPTSKAQIMLHIADYLASRKDLEVLFSGESAQKEVPKERVSLEDYVLGFGKYKGKKLVDVAKENPGWIAWAKENITSEPTASYLKMV